MLRLLRVERLTTGSKAFAAHFMQDGKPRVVRFGQRGAEQFIVHRDEAKKVAYQARHAGDRLDDPLSSGALSWFVLWTAPTLAGGIRNYRKQFNV